jgi:hypothetical protein
MGLPSSTYYDTKRSDGKTYTQAVLALARLRLNVCRRCSAKTPSTNPQPLLRRLDNVIEVIEILLL